MVQLVRLWPAGLGLRPAPLALLVIGVGLALVAVALVEVPFLVKDAAACLFRCSTGAGARAFVDGGFSKENEEIKDGKLVFFAYMVFYGKRDRRRKGQEKKKQKHKKPARLVWLSTSSCPTLSV